MSARPTRASRCSAGSVAAYTAAPERDRGDEREDDRLERKIRRVHQPERRAVIVHPREVEEAGNDLDALVQLEARSHERLCRLIERHDGAGIQSSSWRRREMTING